MTNIGIYPPFKDSFTHEEVQSNVHVEKYQLVQRVIDWVSAELEKNDNDYRNHANPTSEQVIHYFATKSELLKLKLMLVNEKHLLTSERANERSNQSKDLSMDQNQQWSGVAPK